MRIIVNATPLIYLTKIGLMKDMIENYDISTTRQIFNEVTFEHEKYEDAMKLKGVEQKLILTRVDYKEFNALDLEIGDKSLLRLVGENVEKIRKGGIYVIVDDSTLRKYIKTMLRSWKAKKALYFTPEFLYKMHGDGIISKDRLISSLMLLKETNYLKKSVISKVLDVIK